MGDIALQGKRDKSVHTSHYTQAQSSQVVTHKMSHSPLQVADAKALTEQALMDSQS